MSMETNQVLANAQSSLRNKTAAASKNEGELEKQDFMNLFLTQMSHQDPVDPMDSGAMMSQLAQLGTLEQLETMNGQFTDLNATQRDISQLQSLMLLDKDIMIEAKNVELSRGEGKPVYFSLENEADNVKVTIEDREGMPIYTESLGIMASGKHRFQWDGKNKEGYMMPDGEYRIRFAAFDAEGNASQLTIFKSGKVGQVDYQNGKAWISMDNQKLPLSKVKNISNLSSKTFGNAKPLPYMTELTPKGTMTLDKASDERQRIDLSQ